MSTLEILKYTAIIVALITLAGTFVSTVFPKLWDYWIKNKDESERG
jgi:hypothetical protein